MTPKLGASVRQTVPDVRAERAASADERRTQTGEARTRGSKGAENDIREPDRSASPATNQPARKTQPANDQPRFEDALPSAETAPIESRKFDQVDPGQYKITAGEVPPAPTPEGTTSSAKAQTELDLAVLQTLEFANAATEPAATAEADAGLPVPELEAGNPDVPAESSAAPVLIEEQIAQAASEIAPDRTTDQPVPPNAPAVDVPPVAAPNTSAPDQLVAPAPFVALAPPTDAAADLTAANEPSLPVSIRTIGIEPAAPAAKAIEMTESAPGQMESAGLLDTIDAGGEPAARPENPSFQNLLSRQADMRPATAGDAPPLPQPSLPVVVAPLGTVPIEIGLKAMAGLSRFEIRLDPADLGRIDVTLDIGEDGTVHTQMVVDRVETLHLLQRDARTLERAFEQVGLKASDQGVDLSLRDPGQQNQNSRDQSAPWRPAPLDEGGTAGSRSTTLPDITSQQAQGRVWRGAAGIDVRI